MVHGDPGYNQTSVNGPFPSTSPQNLRFPRGLLLPLLTEMAFFLGVHLLSVDFTTVVCLQCMRTLSQQLQYNGNSNNNKETQLLPWGTHEGKKGVPTSDGVCCDQGMLLCHHDSAVISSENTHWGLDILRGKGRPPLKNGNQAEI